MLSHPEGEPREPVEHRSHLGRQLRTTGLEGPVTLPPSELAAPVDNGIARRYPQTEIRDDGIAIDLRDKTVAAEEVEALVPEIEEVLARHEEADVAGFMMPARVLARSSPLAIIIEARTANSRPVFDVEEIETAEPAVDTAANYDEDDDSLIDELFEEYPDDAITEQDAPSVPRVHYEQIVTPTAKKKPSRLRQLLSGRHKYTYRTNYNNYEPGDLVSPVAVLFGGAKYVCRNEEYLTGRKKKVGSVPKSPEQRVPRFGRKKLIGLALGAVATLGIGFGAVRASTEQSPSTTTELASPATTSHEQQTVTSLSTPQTERSIPVVQIKAPTEAQTAFGQMVDWLAANPDKTAFDFARGVEYVENVQKAMTQLPR